MLQINVKQNKLKIAAATATLLVFLGVSVAPKVLAEELNISGNGAESKSEIKTTTSSDTNVQQNNNADVNNDVDVNANTGNNEANKNTGGDVSITTGNIDSSTSVSNGVNFSTVNVTSCDNCGSSGSITISGNGAYSDNKIDLNSSSRNRIHVDQNANIRNYIDEDLITGRNEANENTGGDVSIDTGNIRSRTNLFNDLINFSKIAVAGSPFHDFLVKIFDNGAFSDNKAHADFTNDNDVDVDNTANIINELKHRYVTGENEANKNTGGDVNVNTGDIDAEVNVRNVANVSEVDISCECNKVTPTVAPTSAPTVTVAPTSAPTVAPTGAPAAAVNPTATPAPERVLGASAVLPVTGSNLFFFFLIGNVVMLLMGAYLRLRSGRSPNEGLAL
jgi:hypothetical protein